MRRTHNWIIRESGWSSTPWRLWRSQGHGVLDAPPSRGM